MRTPGPDHPITVNAYQGRVTVSFADKIVANTANALVMHEANYDPVYYVPRVDADMTLLQPTDHATYCPFKGDAAYYSIVAGGAMAENAVWTYEAAYSAVAAIAGHLAFYREHVTLICQPDEIPNSSA